ncbi:type II toxin-antitoxin system RelB/DinJ family antitoxin [Pseudobutyrivibrio ruminis]|uniref:type II toxin-antitoxin system RelB/DinJ family antitoxin n=1 Tax=Pseudobutyrivibrio ruminis TaxID=46206 RepID=UPI0003FF7D0B|nr:type II toxin-antitoxin system RelB/DinJ family antitoxin [Pseudobutyrivibrio ruminis]
MATTAIKDTNFNMRMNKQKKVSLEDLYGNLGMTLAEAVNIFFEKSLMVGGIPFDVRMPKYNKETEDAMQEARDIIAGKAQAKSYSSATELFAELDEEE